MPHSQSTSLVIYTSFLWVYWIIHVLFLKAKGARSDIVFGLHGSEPAAWLLARLCRCMLVQDVWDIPGASVSKGFRASALSIYGSVVWASMRRADLVLASGALKTPFVEQSVQDSKIVRVPNAVLPVTQYVEDAAEPAANTALRTLVYSGSFAKARGSEEILEALTLLGESSYQIRFLCVGPVHNDVDVSAFAQLASRFTSLSVEFMGNVASDEALRILKQAQVGLCLCENIYQYRWTHPVKIGEYLAAGLPIVTTDLPGLRDMVRWTGREQQVYFVDADNSPQLLVDQIKNAFTHKKLQSLAQLPAHCHWDHVMNEVFDSMITSWRKRYLEA